MTPSSPQATLKGEALDRVLQALGDLPPHFKTAFFRAATDLLGDLTPVEAVLGRMENDRPMSEASLRFLQLPPEDRLQTVERAAHTYWLQRRG